MKSHSFTQILLKTIGIFVIIFVSAAILYSSNSIFPKESYRAMLLNAFNSNLINTQVVERAPTGWGADKATECLSLGIGLSEFDLRDSLLDKYPNAVESYNPCLGVIRWAQNSSEYEFISYARYWHTHSEILRWLILLIGIPGVRAILSIMIIMSCLYLLLQVSRLSQGCVKPRLLVIFPALGIMYFLSGLMDIHASMTHALSELSILFIVIISLKVLDQTHNLNPFLWGFAIGGTYVVTSYMINPQSIPVAILTWSLIPLLLFKTRTKNDIQVLWRRTLVLFTGIGFGYLILWISKWIAVDLLTDYPIWDDVISQAGHRSSQSISSLSSGVGENLRFVEGLPAALQSLVANVSALAIRLWDPRYSNAGGFIAVLAMVSVGLLILKHALLNTSSKENTSPEYFIHTQVMLVNTLYVLIVCLTLLAGWYVAMAQHSFDHATYTYKSLSYLVSGLVLSLLSYWSIVLKKEL